MKLQNSLIISFLSTNIAMGADTTLSYERLIRLNTPSKTASATHWFGVNLNIDDKNKQWEQELDVDLRYYHNDSQNSINYSLSKANISYRNKEVKWTFGRQLLDLNPSEKFWQLGTINGRQGMKLLSDKREGLIGLRYESRPKAGFKYSAFLSYLYLPGMNPSVDIKDGKMTSTSEWRKLPPSQTLINNQVVDIHYDIEMPDISKIVLRKTLGATLEYNWGSGKVFSYAFYKPENQIRANAEAYYDLSTEEVRVTARPIVNHHAAIGASVHQKVGSLRLITGVDVIDPNARLGKDFDLLQEKKSTFDSEYFKIEPHYDRESYYHAQAILDRFYYSFSFNYIQLLSSNERNSDDLYSETVKFKRALGGQFNISITDSWSMMFDLKYDLDRLDNIAKGETKYQIN